MDMHHKYLNYYGKKVHSKGDINQFYVEHGAVKGSIIQCTLGCGIEMLFFDYQVSRDQETGGFETGDLIEIFYCLVGNINIELDNHVVDLTENMLGIYDFSTCPQRVILKKGRVKGISLSLDIHRADRVIHHYISKELFTMAELQRLFLKNKQFFLSFGNQSLQSIFLGIIENPFAYEKEYLLIKSMELLYSSGKQLKQRGLHRENEHQYGLYEKASHYMSEHLSEVLTIEEVGKQVGIRGRQLNQYFMKYANQTGYAYLKNQRFQKAKHLLLYSQLSITEIAGEVGWQNPSKFSVAFKERFGVTPSEYRANKKNMDR